MAHLLEAMDARGVAVVVSRSFGGVLLGPDRFKHINNTARLILEANGYKHGPLDALGLLLSFFYWVVPRAPLSFPPSPHVAAAQRRWIQRSTPRLDARQHGTDTCQALFALSQVSRFVQERLHPVAGPTRSHPTVVDRHCRHRSCRWHRASNHSAAIGRSPPCTIASRYQRSSAVTGEGEGNQAAMVKPFRWSATTAMRKSLLISDSENDKIRRVDHR